MKNRLLFCLLTLMLMVLASPQVHADDDALPFYLSAKVASSFMHVDDFDISIAGITVETEGTDDDDTVAGFGAAIGYNFNEYGAPIRTEIEYMYRTAFDYSYSDAFENLDMDINIQTIFLNAYLDWHNDTKFIPYIGGGLGLSIVKATGGNYEVDGFGEVASGRGTETNFAWNIGAGTAYAFTDNFLIDLGYRYVDFGETKATWTLEPGLGLGELEVDTSADVTSHEVLLGFRYQF